MMTKKRRINTISYQTYSILKESIITGKYGPGYWLQETELAEELGVSRSPVREALKQLVATGLVTVIPNKGTFVREFSQKEINEIYEMRELLESYAIRHLPEKLDADQIRRFEEFRQEFKSSYEAKDLEAYTETDSEFHRFIIKCSDNGILDDIYKKVGNMNMMFRIYSLSIEKRFDESLTEHTGIIDSLLRADYEEAVRINRIHLSFAKDTAAAQVERRQNG